MLTTMSEDEITKLKVELDNYKEANKSMNSRLTYEMSSTVPLQKHVYELEAAVRTLAARIIQLEAEADSLQTHLHKAMLMSHS